MPDMGAVSVHRVRAEDIKVVDGGVYIAVMLKDGVQLLAQVFVDGETHHDRLEELGRMQRALRTAWLDLVAEAKPGVEVTA